MADRVPECRKLSTRRALKPRKSRSAGPFYRHMTGRDRGFTMETERPEDRPDIIEARPAIIEKYR
jgi:hypothetical protein